MNPFKKLTEGWKRLMHDEALKKKIYIIIFESDTPLGKLFDVALMLFIVLSILVVVAESIQSWTDTMGPYLRGLEYLFTFFFTAEYLLRIYCSPEPRRYVLSFFGIIDLLATLPFYITWLFGPARYLLIVRTFRLIRVFRVFKLFNFLNEGNLLLSSLYISSRKIAVFFLFVLTLVISIGTLMYMIEGQRPGTAFNNIPNSIYWAIVTLTTVGYGDITPETPFGRFLSAIVMLMGYTIIAVPTGIVSASMIQSSRRKESADQPQPADSGTPQPEQTDHPAPSLHDRAWTVLESEYLIRRPWLTARRDKVQLPTGAVIPEYYVLEYPDWVNVIAITTDRRFVMVRQYRHGLGETRYELCAGVCEAGEAPLLSAQRELYEETGYGGGNWQPWMTLSANASTMNNHTHCFLATGVSPISTQHLEESEDLTVHLLTADEVKCLLDTDEVRQSLMAAPLWKYFADRPY